MAKYIVDSAELTSIADAIRGKTGETGGLSFPTEFVSEIGTLTDTSDADATAADIISGKSAYVNGTKINGSLVPLDTSDATATAFDILNGKTAYVNGSKVNGALVPNYVRNIMHFTKGLGTDTRVTITQNGSSISDAIFVSPLNKPSNRMWVIKDISGLTVFGTDQTLSNFSFVQYWDDYNSYVYIYSATGQDILIKKPSTSLDKTISLTANVFEIVKP